MQTDIQLFLTAIKELSYHHYAFYYVAYLGGFRFMELTDIRRFYLDEDENIIFKPSKGNGLRTFREYELGILFQDMVKNQINWFNRIDYHTFCRYFARYYPTQPILLQDGTKPVAFYVFRYNYIKSLSLAGKTVPELSIKLGELDAKNTTAYVNKVLTF